MQVVLELMSGILEEQGWAFLRDCILVKVVLDLIGPKVWLKMFACRWRSEEIMMTDIAEKYLLRDSF